MSSTFGTILKVTTFGESHGPAMGVVIDGLESGFPLSLESITEELERRRPGKAEGTSPRKETDEFQILSGLFEGMTTGTPLAILIPNKDAKSSDYEELRNVFRPGHADATYLERYGIRDYRGGGRASGRETVCRVAAGAVAKQILKSKGIEVSSRILSIGNATENYDEIIRKAMEEGDSVGGRIQCTAKGVPAGIGEPVFEKLDAVISHAVMSIGAVKGIEFGSGFGCENLSGSVNDMPENAGGILGGISDGNDIVFNVAVKPTPSVAKLGIPGRHDACICLRIGPVIEAMTALVLLDQLYLRQATRGLW